MQEKSLQNLIVYLAMCQDICMYTPLSYCTSYKHKYSVFWIHRKINRNALHIQCLTKTFKKKYIEALRNAD